MLSYVHEVDDVATFLGADQNFEVAELEVEADSVAASKTLNELGLPKEALVGAYIRRGRRESAAVQANCCLAIMFFLLRVLKK